MLIDCMVYIALLLVLLALAFMTFYKTFDAAKALNRNAADITRALIAGERWRADVRATTAPPRVEQTGGAVVLHLPRANGEILYAFREGAVLRRQTTDPKADWEPLLSEVKGSRMLADPRRRVKAWRWELELAPAREARRVKPQFTFQAVPGPTPKP
jgi:hypothetical protein